MRVRVRVRVRVMPMLMHRLLLLLFHFLRLRPAARYNRPSHIALTRPQSCRVLVARGPVLGPVLACARGWLHGADQVSNRWMIMNRMGCDDYIIASIELYLDVINIFSMMMLLMSGGDMG